jgi:hypothetical protein
MIRLLRCSPLLDSLLASGIHVGASVQFSEPQAVAIRHAHPLLLRRKVAMKQVSDARVLRLLTTATHAAERGSQLTAKMLAFARKRKVTMKAVDTNALIQGIRNYCIG